jgi:23S rRNA pseudouridine1911/1915/1917 synthase
MPRGGSAEEDAPVNSGFEYREQVGPEAAGRTVADHLAARYRHSTIEVWRRRIDAGEVFVGDACATPADTLRPGDWLSWRRPPWEEPLVPLAFAVLHRDQDLLAVAKPRGLPSIPNGGFLDHTLLHLVRARFPEATPMHRLGRATSGLVLFARTAPARQAISAAWRDGGVGKAYRTLVSGVPARPTFTIEAPIGLVDHPRLGRIHAAAPGGKRAVSHVRVLALRDGNALVEVTIPTGRPHQIRIHMATAGHPLAGDPVYGAGGALLPDAGLPGDPGYRLHAHRLWLAHPATGRQLDLECAPPPELRHPPED